MSGKRKQVTKENDPDLFDHIHSLGLRTVEKYQEWCIRNGFSNKLNKHWRKRCSERYHARKAYADRRLGQKKREKRKQGDVLEAICKGKLSQHSVTQPHLKRLCEFLRTGHGSVTERKVNREALYRLLRHLLDVRAKLFDDTAVIYDQGMQPGNTYIEALALVAAHYRAWRRELEDWKPRSHSPRRQFASLLRHLFVEYDMPEFFDSVWFTGRVNGAAKQRDWYLYVGRGQNIRQCALPVPLTKKMAHQFMHAPNDLTFEQALRWAQVLGCGGDVRLARAILATFLTADFTHHEFWETVIRWFVTHPMLDRAQVGPIIDYLQNQKFEPAEEYYGNGYREASAPAQPNLSMKGRTPAALLRQVHAWHRNLARENVHQLQEWQPSGIATFEFEEGLQSNGTHKIWTILELLSSKALIAEGRKLKHCVATYSQSCARGYCSIWTMELKSFNSHSKAITIEVSNQSRQICQIRGKWNRLPNDKEMNIVRRWAERSGLTLGRYL